MSRAALAVLLLLTTMLAVAQPRFANGNLVEDGRGNVYYASGEYARMANGQSLYQGGGYGGVAFRGGQAFYPSGQTLRSTNGTLFYQSGQVARQNGSLFHQNGNIALDAGGGRYRNGASTGGGITLREPFPGGCLAIVVRQGIGVGYLLLQLGDGWQLVINLDSGDWEVSQF